MSQAGKPGTLIRGRIVDFWETSDSGKEFEIAVGPDLRIFSHDAHQGPFLDDTGKAVSLSKGQIIQICTDKNDKILSLKVLASPTVPWNPLSDSMRWRTRSGASSTLSRMKILKQRQEILKEIRNDLYEQGFLEVETPLLVKGTCPDAYIETIQADKGYLVTSTEYQLKRMFVGGFERLFTLTRNFRSNDRGRYHSSEFTMLEWARAFGTLDEIEEDTVRFIRKAFVNLYPGQKALKTQGKEIDILENSWERITVREAFKKYLGFKNLDDFSHQSLLDAADQAGVEVPSNFRGEHRLLLSFLLDQLQPHLGFPRPTFLREWPSFMTTSAQLQGGDPSVAEQSELYIAGIEISDGFPFLRDPGLQRAFFQREIDRRSKEGRKAVKPDEKYIHALEEAIPPGAGMALGIDRLVMVLTDCSALAQTQTFSWEEL